MKPTVSIKDVALEAGVSIGTVDRVIHKRGRYSKQSEQLVLSAIEKLDYHPSQIASALVNRRKRLKIGISYTGPSENDFNREIMAGVTAAEKELEPFGVEIVISSTEKLDSKAQQEALEKLVGQNVNAIITLPFNDNSANMNFSSYIPKEIPFATVTNTTWGQGQLFHIGPDDFSMGALIAKLISLYAPGAKVIILAPNYELESTQKRVSGFVNKMNTSDTNLILLQVCPIFGQLLESYHMELSTKTAQLISDIPDLEAIYVTNGFIEPVAKKIKELNANTKVFGHEYFRKLPEYMEQNIVYATIYQKTALQWYLAIKMMFQHLTLSKELPANTIAEFNIILKETLPFTNIGTIYPAL